ncbi:MAG: hypothetical protein C0483_12990 [Pirellula sp.]|nr:hypothetical protein [Pirellula sp.]
MIRTAARPLALIAFLIAAAPALPTRAEPQKEATTDGIEFSETLTLPEYHSVPWIRERVKPGGVKPEVWSIDGELWKSVVATQANAKQEPVDFHLWLPPNIKSVRGVVAITGHGSGQGLYKHRELRKIAGELRLALFMFNGNPMQRGFYPTSLLYDRLKAFSAASGHPEFEHAPLFLYGHSNGTGFSAIFTAMESPRVWGWISMRPGTTQQVFQPGAAEVPGLVMFGEDDPFFAKPSQRDNMAVVQRMRKEHDARWHYAMEPGTGHGPGEKSWTLVFSFLRHSFAARVPSDADPRQGPITLRPLAIESGYLGQNWDAAKGGHQQLPIAAYAEFAGDKSTASWLLNKAYADDWQEFQHVGSVSSAR